MGSKWFCDWCKKDVNQSYGWSFITLEHNRNWRKKRRSEEHSVCENCLSIVKIFVDTIRKTKEDD